MIIFSRKNCIKPIKILDDDEHVGSIKKASYGFYVEINGVYYAPDKRIRIMSGGNTIAGFKKLKNAKEHAIKVLSIITVRPYKEKQ